MASTREDHPEGGQQPDAVDVVGEPADEHLQADAADQQHAQQAQRRTSWWRPPRPRTPAAARCSRTPRPRRRRRGHMAIGARPPRRRSAKRLSVASIGAPAVGRARAAPRHRHGEHADGERRRTGRAQDLQQDRAQRPSRRTAASRRARAPGPGPGRSTTVLIQVSPTSHGRVSPDAGQQPQQQPPARCVQHRHEREAQRHERGAGDHDRHGAEARGQPRHERDQGHDGERGDRAGDTGQPARRAPLLERTAVTV